jgi:hypothetical protein
MRIRIARASLVAVVVSVVALMVGCSRGPDAQDSELAVGYQNPESLALDPQKLRRVIDDLPATSPQRPLLADGRVTKQELDLSWARLRSCIHAKGLVVTGPYVDPITNTDYLYTYSRPAKAAAPAKPDSAAEAAAVRGCEDLYWTPLSSIYSANTPQRMSDNLGRFMGDCMRNTHYPTAMTSTFDQIARNGAREADPARLRQANACLDRGIPALFPHLPYFPRP